TFFTDLKAQKGNSFFSIPLIKYQMVQADLEKLALYQIPVHRLYKELQTAFRASEIGKLQNQHKEIPVVLVGNASDTQSTLAKIKVANKEGILFPVSSLVNVSQHLDYQTLYGGKNGSFVPLALEVNREELPNYLNTFKSLNSKYRNLHIEFGGALFAGHEQVKELMWIMLVALLMLYFILAAQFESLVQPLIILIEIPIDLCASLIFLYLGGASLNIMAMIGMIVMSGIIINDSILKIDTINRLRKEGLDLKLAIQEAGKRRLTPIIMTSLTTILAVLPFLFGEGIGTDLQKPLALALIGGMGVGTIVSIYFIPLAYNYLYKSSSKIEST
ncbi:MAG: efflux RND transporter permease subunit, partial [Bacteroidota bacterium]